MSVDCISKGYKDLLVSLITRDVSKATLTEVLNSLPLCEPRPETLSPAGKAEVEKKRPKPAEWHVPIDYTDETGKTRTGISSPSALIRELFGKAMSGAQPVAERFAICDDEKCRAADAIEILRLRGYVVTCEDEKNRFTLDCKKAAEGGKGIHVFHPAILTMQKKKVETKLSEELREALKLGQTWVRPPPRSKYAELAKK